MSESYNYSTGEWEESDEDEALCYLDDEEMECFSYEHLKAMFAMTEIENLFDMYPNLNKKVRTRLLSRIILDETTISVA